MLISMACTIMISDTSGMDAYGVQCAHTMGMWTILWLKWVIKLP